jgi:hypothetical protein
MSRLFIPLGNRLCCDPASLLATQAHLVGRSLRALIAASHWLLHQVA